MFQFLMFYIYIIYSESSDLFYIGHSANPQKRLEQHNQNDTDKFTGKHLNWEMKATFEVSENKGDADKIEKFLKKQKSRNLIIKLIDPTFVPSGKLAQLVRVPHVRD